MKTQNEAERLANDTLNSIDSLQQVEANPFLFGKIQHRMQIKSQRQQVAPVKVLWRLSAALALFTGLNIASYYLLSANSHTEQISIQQKTTAAQALATEYHLTSNQYNY